MEAKQGFRRLRSSSVTSLSPPGRTGGGLSASLPSPLAISTGRIAAPGDPERQGLAPLHQAFHDAVHNVVAEFDKVVAERQRLKAENQTLLLRIAQFEASGRSARDAEPHQRSGPQVHFVGDGAYGTLRDAAGTAAVPSGQHPVGRTMVAMQSPQGRLPEPTAPPSPRPPPDAPLSSCFPGSEGSRGGKVSTSASPRAKGAHLAPELAPAAVHVIPDDVFEAKEDFGRPSNVSLMSAESRLSVESEDGHHAVVDEEVELQSLEVHPFWSAVELEPGKMPISVKRRTSLQNFSTTMESMKPRGLQRLVLRPSGKNAIAWDFFTICVLLYDLVVIPLQAYQLPETAFWEAMELVATSTWTIDICLSFFKGFEFRGNVELRPRRIMVHYLKTWFIFDFSIVAMDWVLLVFRSSDLVDWLRFSRVRRALRLLRLARLVKHGQRFLSIFSIIRSENWLVIFRIVWLLTMLVAINHFVSCGWYAIGTLTLFHRCWTEKHFDTDDGFAYRYLTSFHWSVTQFTPASMEIVATNTLERFYNIVAIFFGLLMFSSFVSNMTNSMTYLTKINYEKRQRQSIARSYIVGKGVTLDLGNDIMRHITVNSNMKRSLREVDIGAFQSIPKRLLERLRVEVHTPLLAGHALFGHLHADEGGAFNRICHTAMSERCLISGEELFRFGTKATRMYFVVNGSVGYTFGYGESETQPVEVGVKQWLSEASLWVQWEHKGRSSASSACCDLAELDAAEFHTIVSRTGCYHHLQVYAKLWAKCACFESGGADHVADNWGQRLRVSDLVHKAFDIDDANEAQRLVRVMAGNEFTTERVFKAWAKYVEFEKDERRKANAPDQRANRRRGSFLGGVAKADNSDGRSKRGRHRTREGAAMEISSERSGA